MSALNAGAEQLTQTSAEHWPQWWADEAAADISDIADCHDETTLTLRHFEPSRAVAASEEFLGAKVQAGCDRACGAAALRISGAGLWLLAVTAVL